MAAILHSRNWALLAAPIRFTLTNVFSSAEELIFYKQEDGDVVPGSIIINTTVSANLTNPSYKWEYATNNNPTNWIEIVGQTGPSLTVSGTVFESTYLNFGANGDSVNFRVTASQTGRVSSVSETTIKYYNEATDTIQLVLDKPSITIMCDEAGVPNLLNTNNALRVSANGKLLTYDTSGPSSFSVDSITVDPANSITIVGQGLGSIYTINNVQDISTTVSSLSYTVTLNVTVRNTKGNPREPRTISYTYVKIVPATDGANAVTLDLLSDTDVVFANNSGLGYTLPTGNEAKIYDGNIEVPDGTSTYYGIEIDNPQDPNTKVIVPSTTVGGLTASIDDNTGIISLTGSNWTNTQQSFTFIGTYKNKTYRKVYSISKSVSGYDTIALDLYTEASVVFADDKGNNYTLPSQDNYAKLYQGGSIIASGVQYSTTTPSIDGLTVAVTANTGKITLGPANNGWTGNSADIVIKATYNGVEYTKIYTLTKSKKGDPTVIVNLLRNNDIVPSLTDGTNYELPTANNNRIRLYRGGAELTTGITYGPASSSSNGLTAIVSSSGQITLVGNSNSWNQKVAEFEFTATYEQVNYSVGYTITKSLKGVEGAPGADAITIDLYSESDVVAADEFGKNYTNTLPTNYIKLYKGGVELTNAANGVTYALAGTSTPNGLIVSVNSTTGAIALNGANDIWTGDNAFLDFTATYNSKTYTASYSLAKSKRGSSTVFIDLYSEQHVIAADSNGQNYSLPANNYVKLYRGGELIVGAVYGPVAQVTQNGLSLSVDSSTGLISLSGANWSTDQEIFTITAKPSATDTNIFTTQYKITKTRGGSAGIPAFNGALTNESYNVPVSSSGIVSPSGVITNAGGVFDLKNGATSLNSTASFSIVGGTDNGNNWTKTQNNVRLTIIESGVGAGTYTVEVVGGNWTTSVETFTLRGTYGTNYIDRVYILGKDPGTEVVSLTTNRQSFNYTSAGVLVSGQGTATVTATLTGYTGTAYYEFIVDNSTLQNTTTSTYTYTPQSAYSNMPDQISVKVREGSASGAVLATDTISMFGVPQGASGKVVYNGVVYKQQVAQPNAPSGGNFNAATATLTAPADGWSITKPTTTTTPTWASEYVFSVDPGSVTNPGGTWSTPFIDAQSGTDGSANERVELYQATADGSTPTAPTSVVYTITGSVLGTGAGSWTLTMPATPVYPGAVFMTTAMASSNTPGTAITLTSWTAPVMVARNGQKGTDGTSIDVQYSTNSSNGTDGTWTSSPVGAKWIRTGTKTPPATSFTYATGVKFVPELGVEYTVINGVSSYLHIKYSNNGGTSFTGNNGEDVGDWIGTLVNTNVSDGNESPSAYTWQYVKGPPGISVQGDRGLRSAEVQLFYTTAAASASLSQAQADAITYNFSSGTLGGLPQGWSDQFSQPALSQVTSTNKLWAATIRFTETNISGAYSRTVVGPYNWLNFDGLVTFSNLSAGTGSNGVANTSMINGGAITAGSLTVDKIQPGASTSASGLTFGLGQGASVLGIPGAVCGKTTGDSASKSASVFYSDGNYGILAGTFNGPAAGGFYQLSSSGATTGHISAATIATGGIGVYAFGGSNVTNASIANGTTAGGNFNRANGGVSTAGSIAIATAGGSFSYSATGVSVSADVSTATHGFYTTSQIEALGNVISRADVIGYGTSDIRLKRNIKVLDNSLTKLTSLRGVTFDWDSKVLESRGGADENFIKTNDVGVIAQEVEKVLPQAVTTRADGTKAVDYVKLIPLLVECIKELKNQVDTLKEKL